MARLLALALLLCTALPAAAGELIQFRARDGTVGFVDHPSKLPPGASVLSRKRSLPGSGPDPAPRFFADEPARELAPPARRAPLEEDRAEAGAWCQRGEAARGASAAAEARLERAEEEYDDCNAGGVVTYCSRSAIDAAEQYLEASLETEKALAEQCRTSGCLPGWIRAGCGD